MGLSQDERIRSLMDSNISLRANCERLEGELAKAGLTLAKHLDRAEAAEAKCMRYENKIRTEVGGEAYIRLTCAALADDGGGG